MNLLGRLLAVLLMLNLTFAVCFLVGAAWHGEKNAAVLMETYRDTGSSLVPDRFSDYKISSPAKSKGGIHLPTAVNGKTFLKEYWVTRSLSFESNPFSSHREPLSLLVYAMRFPTENLVITYQIGSFFLQFRLLFRALLIAEGLFFLLEAIKGISRTRKILQPLSDMTKQAQSLTLRSNTASPEQIRQLRELAGTISDIDATKLDHRLNVDETQNELQDLAAAINNMLTRIDEAYRAQVRFVSDASHELRTPIAVIQGYTNLLDRWGKNDPATMQEAIDAIKSEADSMKDLIEQLLFLARGDNNTLELCPEDVSAAEIIEEIIKETKMIHTRHAFRLQATAEPILKDADRQLIKQAIRILVDNSIKYTPEDGEIVISLSRDSDIARISVQDDGIGIDPQNLPHIFNRFYRSDESRARETGGSGLGLAIMKQIIDRHEGTIEVVSRKGIGTKTSILLPAKSANQ